MATRIRTLNFLPEVFQTPTNAQFLSATLDQIVDQPNTMQIQGYIGSKFGYGINANDKYVVEPTKVRTDYQLDPGVVFTKTNSSVATDFISYPGITDALKLNGGITNNNDRLFNSQFYSWDPFVNLDMLINFNQYYWLPEGAPAVTVATDIIYNIANYTVTDAANGYDISSDVNPAGSTNPTLTLIRGGTYTFSVNQNSEFWIQGKPGITGYDPQQPNQYTRDILGVENNGSESGVVTFTVPFKDAQDQYNFPGNNLVDVVSSIPFANVNGQRLNSLGGIDGVTALNGRTVMFYNTGIANEQGYVSEFYGETPFDTNGNIISQQTITVSSTSSVGNVITCDSTAGLSVNQTVTFSGTSVGGLVAYESSYTLAGQFIPGKQYSIISLGNTDWNAAGFVGTPTEGGTFIATNAGLGTGIASVYQLGIYYVNNIIDGTTFTVSQFLDGPTFVVTDDVGSMTGYTNQGLYEGGYYTDVNSLFYEITLLGSASDPIIQLTPSSLIPTNQKITAVYGKAYGSLNFYRTVQGYINEIPYQSAILDTLYYQDGTTADKVGIIKIIESNYTNQINVAEDILGKQTYTAPNGVVFTNGLKVTFAGDIYPTTYKTSEYYVQGVGTAITLINVQDMVVPEPFTSGAYSPYDTYPYDSTNFDITLYIPVYQDYITIARNSFDKNAWSRSNRWFHIDVINATAGYLNNPSIATTYATQENKAKRPIIEFYPNLKLFDSCVVGKKPVDFVDNRTTNAFDEVAGQTVYYPDVETYTSLSATLNGVVSDTTTTLSVLANDVTGTFQVGQFITDSAGVLPADAQITEITGTSTLTVTIEWTDTITFTTQTDISVVANDTQNDNYKLFDGATIVFSQDANVDVRNKIYITHFNSVDGGTPIITLTEIEGGSVLPNEGTFAFKGFNNQGKNFFFDGVYWNLSQQKTTINQAPLFDVFDKDGISFGDSSVYVGTSFKGNKLFSYGIGTGLVDTVLGFPLRYSSVSNVGDISFDVPLNSATFNYVQGTTPITKDVSTGYVYNFSDIDTFDRAIGWQTAVAPSTQYQLFSFDYIATNPTTTFVCDIAASTDTVWPNVQVFVNNELQSKESFTVAIGTDKTVISFAPNSVVDTVIEVAILSDQVSKTAYYQVPINLQNNPLNANVTTVNVGDIRGQYQSIFFNNPNTTGNVFGSNNYHDLGNMVPWGTKIIQNSASLVLPGAFLRQPAHNLFESLKFNSQQYITFKTLLADTIYKTEYTTHLSSADLLDDALDQITASKVESAPFFWSDMLPSKSAFATNTYTFANSMDVSRYPLVRVYDFTKANYYGVLVYLTRTVANVTTTEQLIINQDYTISPDSPSLTITKDLLPNDIVTIKEYNQTYGSYVPNTPTKLGMYPAFIPGVVLDSNYIQPTYFIVGHDGSYNRLYGDYIDGQLTDLRDKALLEYETRVYNNLKLSNTVPLRDYDVIPGFFRTTDYSFEEVLEIYSKSFLNWVGQNRIDYKSQVYVNGNQFTYNYGKAANKLTNAQMLQGNWRGIYQYYYDTAEPNVSPWEMIGFSDMPSWWTSRYGAAPFTSDNLVLWNDMAAGINWNNGNPVVLSQFVRPNLLKVLPVDSQGNLVSPFVSVVGNYDQLTFRNNWKVGDVGPAEYSYRKSSTWPFDLMKLLALTKPAEFFNLNVDVDNYKYNSEFNQYLVNDRSHLVITDIEVYGSGTAKTSYINWIVDYEKQTGVNATQNLTDLLDRLDVRLVYRLAGFSDKSMMNFYVEKGTPNSRNASLLIPNESYSVLLYDNIPFDRIVFSSVIVQNVGDGWTVYGNSQTNAYFTISVPKINGNYNKISIEKASVQIAKDYYSTKIDIPYGTKFYSIQEVAQFLASYGHALAEQGVLFDQIESGLELSWNQMAAEFLYWSQSGWEIGSIINLNPAANMATINKDGQVVQPLTLQNQNFVLNQNLYPIQSTDISVVRDGTFFSVKPLNEGDTIAYGQFNIGNFEHGIVFDNTTLFNDVLYNLTTGLRQNRIMVRGVKTADWNGTIDAQGFILNQDNIIEWNPITKYTKGSIVLYKNKYWVATKIVEPSMVFDGTAWKETDYNEIQVGLLPNGSTRSYESTLFYDTNKVNLDKDSDLLSWSLIGYRPRDYLALADLTDITQVNVYKNMIKEKGTRVAANAFKGLTLPQGGIDYDIYDNWAIKTGEFGGVLDNNFVDFRLNQTELTGNPSIVGLTDGTYTDGVQQEVPLYNIFNYGRPIQSPNVMPTLPADTPNKTYPDAGYVNFDDVTVYSYYFNGLNTATPTLDKLYVGEYVWLADYNSSWRVYAPVSTGQLIEVTNNLNGTCTLTFAEPHNLSKYQPIAIINFGGGLNGYRIVNSIVDLYRVTITFSLVNSVARLTGAGIVLQFNNQRVAQPSDISSLPLLDFEFVQNKVWVDTNTDGNWAVYKKSINYNYDKEFNEDNSVSFGSAVAYTSDLGYLVGDSGDGKVYRYQYNAVFNRYDQIEVLTGDTSFGSTIAYSGDLFAISEPTSGSPKVKIYTLLISNTENTLEFEYDIDAPLGVTNWGSSITISGDKNWMYVSAYEQNKVYVYHKSAVTGLFENQGYITASGISSGDNFGYSVTTNYYGDTVFVSAPNKDYNTNVNDAGYTYVFERLVQNFEAQSNSQPYIPQQYSLAFNPGTTPITVTGISSDVLTASSLSGVTDDMAIVFTGTVYGGIAVNRVYYVRDKSGNTFKLALTRGGTALSLTNTSSSMTGIVQSGTMVVSQNGTAITDSDYALIGTTLYMYGNVTAGDIINVSSAILVQEQTLQSQDIPTIGEKFGYSIDTNTYGTELLVGAPFQVNSLNQEGAVYRFTDSGGRYGFIAGTDACSVTVPTTIFINGFAVAISGSAASVASAINLANITNVTASATDDYKLIIQTIDNNLALANDKLNLVTLSSTDMIHLGITKYSLTQVVQDPHSQGRTQFGTVVKFNESGSFVASSPVSTRFAETSFDMSDDNNYNNDTLFDNNTTQFIDSFVNAGAVYMFDYLSNYNESLANVGKFAYAQNINDKAISYGNQPYYGTALDFNNNVVVVGSQNFKPGLINGQMISYRNVTGNSDWSVYRYSTGIVDVSSIQNTQLYSASTNNTLINLDYFDPLQGKLLGVISENLDIVSGVDPAMYDSPTATNVGGVMWGANHVGTLWFDTSNTKFVNYHQNDNVNYNSKWWGRVFPGSDVSVYSWITSNVEPSLYAGPGTPYSVDSYTVEYVVNSTGALVPVYFYWVRNTNIVFNKLGKTLSDTICEAYITNPQATGIAYMAPIESNVFGLYNTSEYLNGTDTTFHIGFATGTNDDVSHSVYSLIRSNYADDFLPGLPGVGGVTRPESLYNRMLESLSGVDESGGVVPDPYLPKPVQSGILARPRQSFFYNRFNALKNYLEYANEILSTLPFAETTQSNFLYAKGETNPSTVNNPNWSGPEELFYNTSDYWEFVNWWAVGYNDSTRSALLVQSYYDLATIPAQNGLIVTVAKNGAGLQETYVYDGTTSTWVRVGLQNGTIQFKSSLWDYSTARLGFGDNFFDTTPFDTYPSEETRYIVRSLNEQLPSEIMLYRNKALILLFNYIMSETIESQNYLPWLNKTSFIDVAHTIRELLPLRVFQSDNQDFLSGYMNEVKPYHVVIKDFLFKYTGTDVWQGNVTDFDLPATYNTSLQKYITPELVYSNPSGDNQYLPTDTIWNSDPYYQWFQNYGLSITGVNDYQITILTSYLSLASKFITVDNAFGFPINGVIQIGDEQIAYSGVDRAYSMLTGLTRGINGTPISNHLPGEQIIIDLPAVLVLDGGRGYGEPPKVTAYIDTTIYPEPTRAAILQPVMNLDQILRIDVIDPGQGYAVLPEIIIEPSATITFPSSSVDIESSTIIVQSIFVQTGDLIRYVQGSGTVAPEGLADGQYYYLGVLESVPSYVIALYTTYADALQDKNRVKLYGAGTGNTNRLLVSARASCVSSAIPVRENNITLRYDRTTYNSQVTEWVPGNFYGSFYAGALNNSSQVSSSSITLENTQPPINSILASAQGAAFEIENVRNEQTLTWSTRTRTVVETTSGSNIVTITESAGGTPESPIDNPIPIGPTTGFYVGMPIKFDGQAFGGLQNQTIYYVKEIVNLTDVVLATDATLVTPVTLSSETAPVAGLSMFIGELTNRGIVEIFYPGILTSTETQVNTNYVTVPKTASGLGGTTGFYVGLPVFFVGSVFGNVVENEQYYVTTVVDDETFTMSKKNDPITLTVVSTDGTSDTILLESVTELNDNDPVIFTDMVIGGSAVSSFGGLTAGQVYYVVVGSINYSNKTIQVSAASYGGAADLSTQSAASDTYATLIDQIDTLDLTTATGSMTLNVGLPVSPGQITGQQFTFYKTLETPYSGVTSTVSGFIERNTVATDAGSDYLYLSYLSGGTTLFYVNMPFTVAETMGGLTSGVTYYVRSMGTISVVVTGSSSSTNIFTCADTTGFYTDMPVSFTGGIFGGVEPLVTYYIRTVVSGTEFTVSDTKGGAEFVLTGDNGNMVLEGEDPFITVKDGGGTQVSLTDSTTVTQFTQTTTSTPSFDVSYKLGGYIADIVVAGTGFAINNTITVAGADLGGATPLNDLILTVNAIGTNGEITEVIKSGTPAYEEDTFYLKVISATELEIFSNPQMTASVSGLNFPYVAGDYAFLPEPFYFNQSIVKYNNQVWQCVISNNDSEFILGKWNQLDSGNRQLNELDRIVGYYQPTVNMPGMDLTQLVTGISYPYNVYQGNPFPPGEEIAIDTIVRDEMVDPLNVNYTIQGEPFTAGYGPEELVPGIVYDNLSMIVKTRPGTNWDVTEYGHTGFNVVSTQMSTSDLQTLFSFAGIVQNPATIALYDLDTTTGLSTRIFNFTVNWVAKNVTLASPLTSGNILIIDLFEVGNGDQLIKSNSDVIPYVMNPSTGFTEMPLDCNYSNNRFNGSGVVKPNTSPLTILATKTFALNNTILCDSVDGLSLNEPVTFQSDVLGGLVLDTVYYIKDISAITNKITVSDTLLNGTVAGPVFTLYDDTGSMEMIVDEQSNQLWTAPYVSHNGTLLSLGTQKITTQTKSATNSVVTDTIDGLNVGDTIVFGDGIFGGIEAHTTYYIVEFVTEAVPNEFIISTTPGGAPVELTDATGICVAITNDYTFVPTEVGPTATIVFSQQYNSDNDFIVLSVLGETAPQQYAFSVPLTALYYPELGQSQFELTNYVGEDNADNAIVQYNGLRLVNTSDYYIDASTNTLNLEFSPAEGSIIAVTTFNSTERQYLNTSYGDSFGGSNTVMVTVGSTVAQTLDYDSGTTATGDGFDAYAVSAGDFVIGETYSIASLGTTDWNLVAGTIGIVYAVGDEVVATVAGSGTGIAAIAGYYNEELYWLELSSGSTSQLPVNAAIQFGATAIGGINVGATYYIATIIDDTRFTVSEIVGGPIVTVTNDTGSMPGYINPPTVANIVSMNNIITPPLASVVCSGTTTTTNEITCDNTSQLVVDQPIIFKGNDPLVNYGNISLNGVVYYIDTIVDGTHFTVKDEYGDVIVLDTYVGTCVGFMGGNETVTVVTGVPHGLQENDLVRIDGTLGSYQLNNNTYYVHVISSTIVGLYEQPYDASLTADNYPVTTVNTYQGGGYLWLDGCFTLTSAFATATDASSGIITVTTTAKLEIGTPIYFSGTTFGGIVAGQKYYIKNIMGITEIKISETHGGSEFELTTDSGSMGVAQWEQSNVDRLLVTVNGYRIPSSSLYLNRNNNLSILTTIVPGDVVVVTSMIPTATPNQLTYIQTVNKSGEAIVHRSNSLARTWLAQPLEYTDSVIYLNDVSRITSTVVEQVSSAVIVDDVVSLGLPIDKRILTQTIVLNYTTGVTLPETAYYVEIVNTAPILRILATDGMTTFVSEGDSLTVTMILGNTLYVAGEQIVFTSVDLEANTVTGLQRGANGTGERDYISQYIEVYGLSSSDQLSALDYDQTWNSYQYMSAPATTTENHVEYVIDSVGTTDFTLIGALRNEVGLRFTATGAGAGSGTVTRLDQADPLQVSDTYSAIFLNTDVT